MLIQIKYKAPQAVRVVLWTTNLILCPDVVHSISLSRNLVTARHRGYYVWWMTLTGIHWSVGWSLTCSLSVFGWRRSLACRHSRFPLLCTRAPPPPPALPVQSRQHRCHLWFTKNGSILPISLQTGYLCLWHTYRSPSAAADTRRILRRSSLCSSIRLRLLSWRQWISAMQGHVWNADLLW